MGYEHYWRLRSIRAWKKHREKIIADFLKLVPHLPRLTGPDGEGEPEFGEIVAFNGAGSNGFEAFYFPSPDLEAAKKEIKERGYAFWSCKTGYYELNRNSLKVARYNLAVTAFLIVAKAHLDGALKIRSDGAGGCAERWLPAVDLVERKLGLYILPGDVLENYWCHD